MDARSDEFFFARDLSSGVEDDRHVAFGVAGEKRGLGWRAVGFTSLSRRTREDESEHNGKWHIDSAIGVTIDSITLPPPYTYSEFTPGITSVPLPLYPPPTSSATPLIPVARALTSRATEQ